MFPLSRTLHGSASGRSGATGFPPPHSSSATTPLALPIRSDSSALKRSFLTENPEAFQLRDSLQIKQSARERTRTSTGLPPLEPESSASTNSAIRANDFPGGLRRGGENSMRPRGMQYRFYRESHLTANKPLLRHRFRRCHPGTQPPLSPHAKGHAAHPRPHSCSDRHFPCPAPQSGEAGPTACAARRRGPVGA